MFKKLALAAAIAALLAACAQPQPGNGMMGSAMHGEMMMTMKPGMPMSEADQGYMAAMQAMGQSMMEMEMTGDPSGDFVRMMIPHHQSAIDMAKVLLQQETVDPEIRAIAEEIIKTQTAEIQQFEAWLKTHDQ